nr:MAG TPA: shufflon protein [Caudoviricetes sp.]
MATPDYSKIWGANSPLAKYEFTEADYLRGWEFIGSMPPARTMFDAWMRKADEKMRWLYDNAFSENSLGGFLFWRLPDTAYFVGEKRALQDGPLDVYLECTIAGRTSKEQMKKLPQGAEIGKTFVDGTATWLVRQFATSAALADHRTKTPLDHPDGSVLKKHLGFEVYDKDEVYNKNEINQSYRKIGNRTVSGDVDWNTLTEPTTYKIQGAVMDAAHHAPPNEYNFGLLVVNRLENGTDGEWRTVQIYFPHSTRGYWSRMYNGPSDYRAEGWLEWRYIPTQNEVETIAEQKASTKVNKSGDTMTGDLTVQSIYVNDWFRINGENSGIHWQKYGGGWHMADKDWIRAWSGKSIYTSGKIRCDAGFEGTLRGTADNANNLGGQSLQWILEQIKNSIVKIAILTGTVAHGGTIPLPNGFLESQCKWTVSPATIVDFATGGDLKGFGCTVDEHRKVSCVAESQGDSVHTIANYIIIGVK